MRSLTASSDDPGKNKRFCRDVFMRGKGTGNFPPFCRCVVIVVEKRRKTRMRHD